VTAGVDVSRLANGLTVATHSMPHLESVAMGLWIGAGARSEAPGEHGISHLLEHMAFKGTSRRSARDIAEAIEAVGGEMNAETSADNTLYYLRLLKEDVALGLDVLGDILTDPLFDAEELAREKHVIVQEIGAALDMPEDLVFDMFQEAAYPGQAIGRSILGTPKSVRAQSAADLRRFLDAHYRGPRMVLAAAGNLDHDALVKLAETHLGGLPATASELPQPGLYTGGEQRLVRKLQEAQILLGFEGPSYCDRRFTAAHIFSAILGGGMASRLFQEVRENRGLCYSIYSFYSPFTDTGLFGIHAATSEGDIAKLVPVVLDELCKTVDGVTPAELARAKAQLRSGLLMVLESPLARAGQIARHVLIHGRPLAIEELVAKVEAVTRADLAELAAGLLASRPTLASIGPVKRLPRAEDIGARLAGAVAVDA
jgi:predicted Zn-dependent peptidase